MDAGNAIQEKHWFEWYYTDLFVELKSTNQHFGKHSQQKKQIHLF